MCGVIIYPNGCMSFCVFVFGFSRKLGPDPSVSSQPMASSPAQPSSDGSQETPLRRAGKTSDIHRLHPEERAELALVKCSEYK